MGVTIDDIGTYIPLVKIRADRGQPLEERDTGGQIRARQPVACRRPCLPGRRRCHGVLHQADLLEDRLRADKARRVPRGRDPLPRQPRRRRHGRDR